MRTEGWRKRLRCISFYSGLKTERCCTERKRGAKPGLVPTVCSECQRPFGSAERGGLAEREATIRQHKRTIQRQTATIAEQAVWAAETQAVKAQASAEALLVRAQLREARRDQRESLAGGAPLPVPVCRLKTMRPSASCAARSSPGPPVSVPAVRPMPERRSSSLSTAPCACGRSTRTRGPCLSGSLRPPWRPTAGPPGCRPAVEPRTRPVAAVAASPAAPATVCSLLRPAATTELSLPRAPGHLPRAPIGSVY